MYYLGLNTYLCGMKTIYICISEDGMSANAYTTISGMSRGEDVKRVTLEKGLLKKDFHRLRNGKKVIRTGLNFSKRGRKGGKFA